MKEIYLQRMKAEFVPALGCTEPVAVAFAAAKACETLGSKPEDVEILVSGNVFKNGVGVGIPGSGMVGLHIAGAMGALGGKTEKGLEVLSGISPEIIEEAKQFVADKKVTVDVKYDVPKLYIECFAKKGTDKAHVIIQDRHTNIVFVEFNEEVIYKAEERATTRHIKGTTEGWSMETIYDFITTVNIEDIRFIEKGIELNKNVAEEGLRGNYGLGVGKSIKLNIEKGLLSEDLMNRSIMYTAAASDARMAGSTMPVMSNCGSGNQGISVSLPVVIAAEELKVSHETLLRALALSILTTIYMKSFVGQLSALCGISLSTTGAACAITYMMGGTFEQISMTIKNMTGGVTGMICDGAKYGCSNKLAAGVGMAVQAALLAMNNNYLNGLNGIIDNNVETTIRNIGRLANEGMGVTDEVILKTMLEKIKNQ